MGIMASSEREYQVSEQGCFYWDERLKTCRSSAGGLFLPVEEHIVTYCQTEHHVACVYFRDVAVDASAGTVEDQDDRRRYSRVVGRYPFQINDIAINCDTKQSIVIYASAIDFSLGGIRFETDHLLPVDTLIEFALTGSYSNVLMNGIGRVKWCRSREDSSRFHVGVAFAEKIFNEMAVTEQAKVIS